MDPINEVRVKEPGLFLVDVAAADDARTGVRRGSVGAVAPVRWGPQACGGPRRHRRRHP
ncbi:DUF6207 family protein [Streptomyces sp. NPDC015032]|uniref:DUF6207 family protein n=1 Tax=Streptomyces sp. NPDC015032 TaxID=3364937 RepID=UPI0036F579C0